MARKSWPVTATFKYQRGMLVTLDGLPGIWKVYSPHSVSEHYWCEPSDPNSRALLSLTGRDSKVLTFSPAPGHGKGCTVDVEHGMVVAPTREITRVARPETPLT